MGDIISALTELAEPPAIDDWLVLTDKSDTTQAGTGTTKKNKPQYGLGAQVNAQTGTTYTYLTTDFRKLVTHTNAAAIAGTLPQAGASFPAGWYMLVQNRGAGALTITPTTSTVDGAATLVLNQNEGSIVVSDGTNYFTLRGKATGAAGVGDVVGPASATDNALARFDTTTGKLIQNSTVTLDDTGAFTVPEMAAPGTPAAGKVAVYAKTDGKLYIKDDVGTETDLTSTGAALTADAVSAPVYAADAGASDAYAITLSPVPSGYTAGTHYRFKANTANTGACTLDVNSLGAKTIKKVAGGITTDLADNDIRAGQFVDVVYDGTNMQMQSTLGNASGSGTNPTDTVMPYNNAGTFADSHLTRTSTTVTTMSAGTLRGPNGSASAPTFSFTNSASTGLWSDSSTTLRISANTGAQVQLIRDSSTRSRLLLNASGNGAMFGFGSDTSLDAGLYRPASGHIAVTSDGADPTPTPGTLYSPTNSLGTFGSELVVDMQVGNRREFVLNTNYTMRAPANARTGTILTIRLKQDATGSRTVTWNSAYKWAGGTAPTLTTAANAVDIFVFLLDGTNAEELSSKLDVK